MTSYTAGRLGEADDTGDNASGSGPTLGCGVLADDVLEQVADGHGADRSAHQSQCVHCEAALQELTQLWSPVIAFGTEPIAVPPGLSARIKAQVNQLVADVWYTLQLTDEGSIRVAARVVGALARDAASRVPGVRAALGRTMDAKIARAVWDGTRAHRHPRAAIGVLGRTAVIDLALAVAPGQDVGAVARHVQERVVMELRDGIGLKTVTVNVSVDDIIE